MKLLTFPILTVATVLLSLPALAQVKYMVIIGCDGMSPDGVLKSESPVMKRMMHEGAFTLRARGVMPTSSSPNWASMIMGAGPEQHGVTSNDWKPDKFNIPPTVKGPGGIFPTIFSVLREQKPQAVVGVFHDWGDYGRLFERNMVDVIENPKGPTNTVERAVAFIKTRHPTFTFIHLDHVDHAGHEIGHGTDAYYASVSVADKLIGQVVDAIESAGMKDSTLVLVTADHGGKGKGHGGETMGELEIPWIITGPGIRSGHEIKTPVNTYDTAATIAYAFGLKQPEAWVARPVIEAFAPR